MSVQRALELGLLASAYRTRDAMASTVKALNGYEFRDASFAWVWDHFKKTWAKGELIRFDAIEGKAKAEADDIQEPLLQTILEVWKAEPSTTPKTDAETLRDYHRHDGITKGMDRATKALIRGDVDGAHGIISRLATESAPNTGLEISAVLDFNDWANHERIAGIPTGLMTFDEVTMGGPRPGDFGVAMGVTNMGKSLLATNFGFNGFKHGRRVLAIDSENGLQETRVRFIARATRLHARALTRRGLNYSADFKQWAEGNSARIHAMYRILHIGVEQVTMDEVEAKIDELCSDGWAPELITFDSPDHVITQGSQDNPGAVAQRKYTRCKAMAQKYKAVMWAITQAKQDAEGKIATNKSAAWGYDKSRLADCVLTINPGLDDKGNPMTEKAMGDRRCLFVAKARKYAGRFIIPLETDFKTSYIAEQTGIAPSAADDDG